MAIPVWPASLPQELITDGYGQQAPNTVIATQMDVGPGKRRRRTSAGVQPVQGQIVVTGEQLETLREFFHKDLGDGTLRFRWIDPVSSPNPAGDARMVLDGTSGTYASTPHSEAVDITGDMALVARIAPEVWAAGGAQSIVSKRAGGAGDSYQFRVGVNGELTFLWVPDGAGTVVHTVAYGGPARPGPAWVACVLAFNAGGSICHFYESSDGATWEPLGSDYTTPNTARLSSDAPIYIGALTSSNHLLNGKIYRAQIYSGAGFNLNGGPTGTLAADFNPADAPRSLSGGGSFTSSATGEAWTLHGNATIHNPTVGVPVEMRFTEPPQWSARASGIYNVALALEILP